MLRRHLMLTPGLALLPAWARAALSEGDAAGGIRAALSRGAEAAVSALGKTDGFMGNPRMRIELPGYLKDGAKLLRMTGQGKRVDDLLAAMNHAAEAAMPAAKPLLVNAVRSMSVEDGLKLLRGGDDAATQFFASKTRVPLHAQFLPIVTRETEKYNAVAGKAAGLGLLKGDEANIQQYVTGKALDGLYQMIADEEKKIRQDPVGTGSALLKAVFGSL